MRFPPGAGGGGPSFYNFSDGISTINPAATRYLGTSMIQANVIFARVRIAGNCTFSRMSLILGVPPGAGDQFTARIYINGAIGNQVVILAGAAQLDGQDLVNVDALLAGDFVSVQLVNSATAAVQNHVSVDFEVTP